MKKVLLSLLTIILLAGTALFMARKQIDRAIKFFSTEPPKIVFSQTPPGVGLQPIPGEIKVSDPDNGLREVIVRAEQGTMRRELVRRGYQAGVWHDTIPFEVPGKEAHLPVKPLQLTVLAIDRSMWSNSSTLSLKLNISYQRPKIEVLSYQHNLVNGGTGFAMYRATGQVKESGIKVNDLVFRGYPAAIMDKSFEGDADVYFSFFAAPVDAVRRSPIVAFVQSPVGNSAKARVPYLLKQKRSPELLTELSADFLRDKVEPLVLEYAQLKEKEGSPVAIDVAEQPSELAQHFRYVNENYRALVERRLRAVFAQSQARQLWEGAFIRPIGGASRTVYGDRRKFSFRGNDAGTAWSLGIDMRSGSGGIVRAANNGVVVLADELGPYGRTIIIDHGFGLFSLYANLAEIGSQMNEEVTIGKPIGKAGQSGLAQSDQLHFEIRIHGVPVRPIEWWDGHWIKDHIALTLKTVKHRVELEEKLS